MLGVFAALVALYYMTFIEEVTGGLATIAWTLGIFAVFICPPLLNFLSRMRLEKSDGT